MARHPEAEKTPKKSSLGASPARSKFLKVRPRVDNFSEESIVSRGAWMSSPLSVVRGQQCRHGSAAL